jgi:hypothetical protein
MFVVFLEGVLLARKKLLIETLGDETVTQTINKQKSLYMLSLDNSTESKKNEIIFGMITYSLNGYYYTIYP